MAGISSKLAQKQQAYHQHGGKQCIAWRAAA